MYYDARDENCCNHEKMIVLVSLFAINKLAKMEAGDPDSRAPYEVSQIMDRYLPSEYELGSKGNRKELD